MTACYDKIVFRPIFFEILSLLLWGGLLCICPSCSEDEQEQLLPDAPVRATLRLDDAEYVRLQNKGEYIRVTEKRGPFTYIGVGGLLVVNSMLPMDEANPYAVYDLYCPYCYYRSTIVPHPRVEVSDNILRAVCPECKSEYDISSGFGGCIKGPGKQLQVYHARYSAGNHTLILRN